MYLLKTLNTVTRAFRDDTAAGSVIMQHDKNVDGIIFLCDGADIDDINRFNCTISVIYTLPDSAQVYITELNTQITGVSGNFFSNAVWDFPPALTARAGTVTYHLCIIETNNDEITKEWHSQKNSFSIIPSLSHDSAETETEVEQPTNAQNITVLQQRATRDEEAISANSAAITALQLINKRRDRKTLVDVCPQGYTVDGAQPNTLAAFTAAREKGFDMVAVEVQATADHVLYITDTGKVNSNVDIWTVNNADITSSTRPLSFTKAVNHCAQIGLGIAVILNSTHLTNADFKGIYAQLNGHGMEHFYICPFTRITYTAYVMSAIDVKSKYVIKFDSQPSIADLTSATSGNYTTFRTIANDCKILICYNYAQSQLTQNYVDSIYALGYGFASNGNETLASMAKYLKYCQYNINPQYTANDAYYQEATVTPADDEILVGG